MNRSPLSQEDRKLFIKKVYCLLVFELVFISLIIFPFVYFVKLKDYLETERWFYFVLIISSVITMLTLICYLPYFPRKSPWNFIMLQTLAISLGIFGGALSAGYKWNMVFLSFIETSILVWCITMIVFFTSRDISTADSILLMIPILFVIVLLCASFILILFADQVKLFPVIVTSIVVTMFSVFLLYDTSVLVKGVRRPLESYDYVLAVMHLLVDIVCMFTATLKFQSESMIDTETTYSEPTPT